MPAIWLHHLLSLAGLAGILLVAAGAGRFVLGKTGIHFASTGERWFFATAAGLGALSHSVFVLGSCQWLYPAWIWTVLCLFGILAAAGGWPRPVFPSLQPMNTLCRHPLDRISAVLLGVSIGAGVLLVLTPAIGNDSLTYHLAVPKLFLKHHGFYFIPGNIFSQYPLGAEMLYSVGLHVGGDATAKGIHFAFALMVLTGMGQFSRRHLEMPTHTGLALLIFFTVPSVFSSSHTAYSDLAFTLYTFASVYAFCNWFSRQQAVWIALCGALTGLAMSMKYAGLFLPFLGILGILWACRQRRIDDSRQALKLLGLYGSLVLLLGCPYYLKNWFMAGNPFYPFFYGIFGGVGWDADQARRYDLFHRTLGMGRGFLDYLMLPWNVSVHARMNSPRFDGILGPVFLLTLPFIAGLRRQPGAVKILLVFCGLMFLFWAVSVQQIRYLIPILPFLSLLAALVVRGYRRNKAVHAFLLVSIFASLGYNGHHIVRHLRIIDPVPVVVGSENPDAFYERLVLPYGMFRHINTRLPEGSKVFFIYMRNLGYLCDRPYYSDAIFESHTMEKILSGSESARAVCWAMNRMGITHILYDARYVFGERSTFSERNRVLFMDFQNRHLSPVKSEEHLFYLFRLEVPCLPGSDG